MDERNLNGVNEQGNNENSVDNNQYVNAVPGNFSESNYTAPNLDQRNMRGNVPKGKNSELGKWAFALSLLGCTSFIGLILAIIDIAKKDGRKKTFSFAALGICGILFMIFGVGQISNLFKHNKQDNSVNNERVAGDDTIPTEVTTEVTTEATTELALSDINDSNYMTYERKVVLREGFDSETNNKEDIYGYQFDIPTYWGTAFINDGVPLYFPYEKQNEFAYLTFNKLDSTKRTLEESDISNVCEKLNIINQTYREFSISNYTAYEIKGKRKEAVSDIKVTGRQNILDGTYYGDEYCIMILDPENNSAIAVILFETFGTNFDYREDVMKICESFTCSGDSNIASGSGVSSDFKDMLDAYEEFMDEYIEFMEKYNQNPTDAELMSEYMDIMIKYNNYVGTISKLDESEMTDEEAAYYLEVTSRVTQKLLEAGMSN